MRRKICVIATILLASLSISCGGLRDHFTVSVEIIPGSANITQAAPGNTIQFKALATADNGATSDVTGTVTWASSNVGVATIPAAIPGGVSALVPGLALSNPACVVNSNTTITATTSGSHGNVVGTAILTCR